MLHFSYWSLISALFVVASAQVTILPTNASAPSSGSTVLVALENGNSLTPFATVLPLTSNSLTDLTPAGLVDPLFVATSSNENNIPSSRIVYISCDPAAYPGLISASDVFAAVQAQNVTAILFYSTTARYCNVTGQGSSSNFLYTMTGASDSQTILNTLSASNNRHLYAQIGYAASINDSATTNGTTGGSSNTGASGSTTGQNNQNGLGPSPTTAVAMIILYSITGLITGLFLIIIVTGAVRAHRHPERYGPRAMLGSVRQSRAKGLGRAILDTIPIVKFGEQPAEGTAKDIELGDSTHSSPQTLQRSASEVDEARARAAQENIARRNSTSSARSGIGPAAGGDIPAAGQSRPVGHTTTGDIPGCSICTDDFEAGQDLRVLPCDHKFHPACIDPWLLNVSGTCPLCRIDLHPPEEEDDLEGDEFPPPIGADSSQRNSIRRSLLLGLMGSPRTPESSADERLAAIRRLRAEQVARRQLADMGERPTSGDVSDERERRRRSRFSLFGVRTRREENDNLMTQPAAEVNQANSTSAGTHQ